MNNEHKAVILARVSSKSQEDEGYSLDAQVKLLENYCENKNLRVMHTFKITESASKSVQRNIFKKAMDYIEKHGIKHLVIEKVDRHVRNLHDAVETHDWLVSDEHKQVHFVKDSLVLHKNSRSQEWLNWGIRVVMAKNYIDNLREEAMKGWAEKLAQGWLPAPPPPGYMTVVRNGKRIHEPDPKTSKIMQHAFALYLKPNQNVRTVTDELRRLGVTTRKGRPMSKSNVHRALHNPFYIGINQFDGKEYPGAQEPILTKSVFKAVQKKLGRGRPIKYRKHNPVLKNVITCAYCGKTVTWQKQKGKLYGACQRRSAECKAQKFLKESDANRVITQMLDDLVSPSLEVVGWLTDLLRTDFRVEVDHHEQAQKLIEERIKRLKAMDEMLYDDKLSGEITGERYAKKHKEFTDEIDQLKQKLGGSNQDYKDAYMEGVSIIELSQAAKAQFKSPKLDNDEKRSILTKLFAEITHKDGSISVKYTKLTQAIAHKSGQTRSLYAKAEKA